MAKTIKGWKRQGEAFWRAHHEAWKRSDLNQREYCEAQHIPQKSFENWRIIFKAEPQPIQRKLLYRHGGLGHTLSHSPSHTPDGHLSHVAYPSLLLSVPPPRDGHRRRFSDADRQRILEQADQPGANLSEIARRYGIDRPLLCRWRRKAPPPVFLAVELVDAPRNAAVEGAAQ